MQKYAAWEMVRAFCRSTKLEMRSERKQPSGLIWDRLAQITADSQVAEVVWFFSISMNAAHSKFCLYFFLFVLFWVFFFTGGASKVSVYRLWLMGEFTQEKRNQKITLLTVMTETWMISEAWGNIALKSSSAEGDGCLLVFSFSSIHPWSLQVVSIFD